MKEVIEKLIKEKEVRELIQWSATTIWRRRKEGNFPLPIRKGGTNFYRLSEIQAYITSEES